MRNNGGFGATYLLPYVVYVGSGDKNTWVNKIYINIKYTCES